MFKETGGGCVTEQASLGDCSAIEELSARGRHAVTTGPKAINDGPPSQATMPPPYGQSSAECHSLMCVLLTPRAVKAVFTVVLLLSDSRDPNHWWGYRQSREA